MDQSAYYVIVVVLGLANVLLAAVAFHQRSRQLAGRQLHEAQFALAERRNEMAAERMERLDRQLALLTSIRDSVRAGGQDSREPARNTIAGVIDIGSTTVRLVVVGSDPHTSRIRTLADERAFLHLGAEVASRGEYGAQTIRDVCGRVLAFQHHARSLGCRRLQVVLTAPGRSGANPGELVAAVAGAAGCDVAALTPRQEAELAFQGAAMLGAAPDQRVAVCDVGGGSTEIAFGTPRGGVTETICFEIGALTLAEECFDGTRPEPDELERARSAAVRTIVLEDAPRCEILLASGGSARSLAKLVGPVADADELAEGLALSVDAPRRVSRRIRRGRRRSLPAGILLLTAVQSQLGLPVTVSRSGMREGVLERLLADGATPAAGGAPAGAPTARSA